MRILILEDDENTSETLKAVFEHLGFHDVLETSSAKQAMYCLDTFRADLIITDLYLESSHGFDFIRDVRSKGFIGHICLMTGDNRSDTLEAAILSGADTVLKKPFTVDDIERLIQLIKPKELPCTAV